MTDKEIIKALKYCQDTEGDSCQCCPYNSVAGCQIEIFKDTLNLITRQQSEIEKLNVELVGMRGACNSYKMHYDNAKTEIERLNNNLSAMAITLSNSAKETRNEAIKEFAERLKEKSKYVKHIPAGEFFEGVDVEDIDNLVKEMVGEQE